MANIRGRTVEKLRENCGAIATVYAALPHPPSPTPTQGHRSRGGGGARQAEVMVSEGAITGSTPSAGPPFSAAPRQHPPFLQRWQKSSPKGSPVPEMGLPHLLGGNPPETERGTPANDRSTSPDMPTAAWPCGTGPIHSAIVRPGHQRGTVPRRRWCAVV